MTGTGAEAFVVATKIPVMGMERREAVIRLLFMDEN